MVTVDERIDQLSNDGNTYVRTEIEDGHYHIYYIDSSNVLHKLTCIVSGEDIISESDTTI